MPRAQIQMVVTHAGVTLDMKATLQKLIAQVNNILFIFNLMQISYYQQSIRDFYTGLTFIRKFISQSLAHYNCQLC